MKYIILQYPTSYFLGLLHLFIPTPGRHFNRHIIVSASPLLTTGLTSDQFGVSTMVISDYPFIFFRSCFLSTFSSFSTSLFLMHVLSSTSACFPTLYPNTELQSLGIHTHVYLSRPQYVQSIPQSESTTTVYPPVSIPLVYHPGKSYNVST